jgi:hypothetical protein
MLGSCHSQTASTGRLVCLFCQYLGTCKARLLLGLVQEGTAGVNL